MVSTTPAVSKVPIEEQQLTGTTSKRLEKRIVPGNVQSWFREDGNPNKHSFILHIGGSVVHDDLDMGSCVTSSERRQGDWVIATWNGLEKAASPRAASVGLPWV